MAEQNLRNTERQNEPNEFYEERLFERYEQGETWGNLLAEAGQEVQRLLRLHEGAAGRIRELEQALDRAADDLRSEGHYALSKRAYAPLETEGP